jgi:hypothetical protein
MRVGPYVTFGRESARPKSLRCFEFNRVLKKPDRPSHAFSGDFQAENLPGTTNVVFYIRSRRHSGSPSGRRLGLGGNADLPEVPLGIRVTYR